MWRRDERSENVRTFGDFTVYSETNAERQTAHVVRFPDGRELRVLPDERSGAKRATLVRQAVERLNAALEANTAISDEAYMWGLLYELGFDPSRQVEELARTVSIGEWLVAHFREHFTDALWYAEDLLDSLDADGWEVRRRDGV